MTHYLGLDLSTQQLKGIVISSRQPDSESNESYTVLHEECVVLDSLGFGTTSGAIVDGNRVTAPVRMWLKALDLLLEKLKSKVDLSKIKCIGGCAQQHGTVYWKKTWLLNEMKTDRSFEENLADAFSLANSPIWMDSSTTAECRVLESKIGGPLALAELTGSRAYERFGGNQIAKIAKDSPQILDETTRISIISSFVASLFLGDVAPIDFNEASGTNLMNIRTNTWSQKCIDACVSPDKGNELVLKLGGDKGLAATGADIGPVCPYVCERFGFSTECRVSAFSGDNAASFVGMGVDRHDVVMSLGSSDTLLLWTEKTTPAVIQGHLMTNPIDPDYLFGMLCFKNGSLIRDRICEECANGNWNKFNELLHATPAGNAGRVGVYFDFMEIIPPRQGRFRFDLSGSAARQVGSSFEPSVEIRALIEGQFMCKRIYAEKFGLQIKPSSRLLVTGGASSNAVICQVISDVFNMQVFTLSIANSAALGGAILAQRCVEGTASIKPSYKLVASPRQTNVYDQLLPKFRQCLKDNDLL